MTDNKTTRFSLSGSHLKYIACVSMFLDHFAKAFSLPDPYMLLLSGIAGRLAFPLYCFLLTEGFFHTGSRARYIRNMALLAIFSEIPFDLVHAGTWFSPQHQNTCFTLLAGLLLFLILEQLQAEKNVILPYCMVIIFAIGAQLLHFDYGAPGMVLLATLYLLRFTPYTAWASLVGIFFLNLDGFGDACAFLAYPLIRCYNGTRGRQFKWGFYLFYPLHLLVLAWLVHCVKG